MLQSISVFSALWYIGYIVFAFCVFSNIPSISQTYYEIESKWEGKGRYFTAWCSMLSILVAISLYAVTEGQRWCWLTLPTVLGLYLVGVVPEFYEKQYSIWHYVGAGMSAICAIAIVICEGYWLVLAISSALSLAVNFITKKKDIMLWAENMCFVALLSVVCLELF